MFPAPTVPPDGNKFTVIDATVPVVLVAVNLSIMARPALGAVYWVVCAASICLEDMSVFTVIAIIYQVACRTLCQVSVAIQI